MKVWELENGFGMESLVQRDRSQPQPGTGQALVRMRAWSLNYRDLMIVQGTYHPKLPLPMVPLSDGAGEVVSVGPGVTRVRPGDSVVAIFMQSWLDGGLTEAKARSALGGALPGLLAEYVVLDAEGLVPFPEHLSLEEAATLPCAAVTAWHALVTEGDVRSGETVLIQGSGGVSLFALQFARARGARVVATTSSDIKMSRLRELGAEEVFNYRLIPDWGERVRKWTGGVGVDHVVEVGGAGTLSQSLRAVRMGGRISLIGVLSGAGEFNPIPILMKGVRLQGIFVGSRDMFLAMNRTIAEHRLHPIVDRVFPLEAFPAALRHLESGSHFGKIVLSAGP